MAHMRDNAPVSVTPAGAHSALVRISCPDTVGFGCDLARTIFDFGLVVEQGDFSTDGKWSFLIFRARSLGGATAAWGPPVESARLTTAPCPQVRPGNNLDSCPWPLLKQRLEAVCPSDPAAAAQHAGGTAEPFRQQHFIFQVEVTDRVGLLHDVTQALWERELTGAAPHPQSAAGPTAPPRLSRRAQCTARTCPRARATRRWTCSM